MLVSKGLMDKAFVGRILRDSNGNWTWGFVASIGQELVDGVELQALLFGLNRAWEEHIEKIMVETDSKNVIHYINEDMEEGHHFFEEILKCKKLLHMFWICQMKFVLRQANNVVDCFAKLGQHFGD